MIRRLPILPTLIVGFAVATMLAFGVWQLQRKAWKEALIARYAAAEGAAGTVAWPRTPEEVEGALFHRSRLKCESVNGLDAAAGRNAQGTSGWAQVAHCRIAGGGTADVVLGWSQVPQAVASWRGGDVEGLVVPGANRTARLLADPPQAGLAASGRPDPRDLPNNHLAYAVQWFLFAGVALVIYALALRKRVQG